MNHDCGQPINIADLLLRLTGGSERFAGFTLVLRLTLSRNPSLRGHLISRSAVTVLPEQVIPVTGSDRSLSFHTPVGSCE